MTSRLEQIGMARAPIAKATFDSTSPEYAAGVIAFDVSGTAVRIVVPDWLKGRYASFHAVGAACDILFGGSAVEVVYDQDSSITNEVITIHANTGRRIPSGEEREWVVPNDSRMGYMSVEASGSGKLVISITGDKIANQRG